VDNVTLSPDIAGTYEVGLRVDDGLDSSPLATRTVVASGTPASSSSGGGGGCSLADRKGPPEPSASAAMILCYLLPAVALAVRRRITLARMRASRTPPPGRPASP
jgi:hypothetical protein